MFDNSLAANEKLTGQLVRRFMPPLILASIGVRAASFINTVLAGRFLGASGLAVVSLVSSLDTFYAALGLVFAVGGSVVSGMAIGRGDTTYCNSVFTLASLMAVAVGVFFTVFGIANVEAVASFLGAEGDNIKPCCDYLTYYFWGSVPMLLLYIPLRYLPVIGRPARVMTVQLIFGVINIAAFSILVLGFSMNMAALGIARTLSSLCAFIAGCVFLMGNKSPLAFCNVHGVAQKIKELVLAGSPRSVEKVLAAARTFFINQILVRGGAGDLLPCWSLVITTQGLMATFIEGIADTAQSLSSIAYGEKDYRNIRLTIKKTFFYGAFVTILMAALLAVFRSQIVTLFGQTDPVLAAISATGLLFIAVSLVFNLASNIIVNFFTATSRSWIATTISVCRIFIFSVVPAWFLFPHYSINAVFGSFLLLEVGGLLVLGASLLLVRARSPNLSPFLLLDRQEEQRIKAIDFSVLNDTEEITDAAAKIGEFCREHDIPSKERFHVSLAIEEMLLMIKEHAFKPGIKEYCDVRIAIYSGVLIMRIRDIGKHFNPVEYYYNNKDSADGFMETIGVDMILKMAMNVEYRETYGVNNLIITI